MSQPHDSAPQATPKLSKQVYRRRRIAVLAGLLAFIVIIVMLIVGPSGMAQWFGSGDKAPAAESDADTKGESTSKGKPADEEKAPTCETDLIAVEALTNEDGYADDAKPKFSLRVTNHNEASCDLDLGTKTIAFVVTSGDETYWDSRDCQLNPESTLVRMEPGQTLETEPLEWDRTRSSTDTCDDERAPVPAGGASYHLSAEVAGVESEQSRQFLLY